MIYSRRTFLRILTILPLWPAARTAPRSERPLELLECGVAGLRFYVEPEAVREMHHGEALGAVAEPENPYDPDAVRLELDGRKIGYVPRNRNAAVAHLLHQGTRVSGELTYVDADRPPWEAVRCRLMLESEPDR